MCFEFGSFFGKGRREDYGGERPSHRTPHGGGRGLGGNRGNNGDYGGTGDHKAAVDEAGHKAYHDGARKDQHADAGDHGLTTAYVHDKGDSYTPKHPAWHNKVGDDAGYTYTARPQGAAPDRKQEAAMDYHHYPTTAANTTTLVRY